MREFIVVILFALILQLVVSEKMSVDKCNGSTSELNQAVVEYLSESFTPITITASRRQWNSVAYKTRLFSVSTDRRNAYIDPIPHTSSISFVFPKVGNHDVQKVVHPAMFLSTLFGQDSRVDKSRETTTISFELENFESANDKNVAFPSNKEDDDELLTLDTNGLIPDRWVRMLYDFHLTQKRDQPKEDDQSKEEGQSVLRFLFSSSTFASRLATTVYKWAPIRIDDWIHFSLISPQQLRNDSTLFLNQVESKTSAEQVRRFWESKLQSVPDSVLRSAVLISHELMESYMKIHVFRAPSYPFLGSPVVQREHLLRRWYTRNGSFSSPTDHFLDRLKNHYTSFYGRTFTRLCKLEGGVDAKYIKHLPWGNIHQALQSPRFIGWDYEWDTRSHHSYHSSPKLPVEELVVLEEALKAEGADFSVDRPRVWV